MGALISFPMIEVVISWFFTDYVVIISTKIAKFAMFDLRWCKVNHKWNNMQYYSWLSVLFLRLINIENRQKLTLTDIPMVERIRKIIECSGLSDRAFAIKCGINQPTLFNQLKGIRAVSLDTVLAISKTFPDVSRDWLLLCEGDMTKELVDRKSVV